MTLWTFSELKRANGRSNGRGGSRRSLVVPQERLLTRIGIGAVALFLLVLAARSRLGGRYAAYHSEDEGFLAQHAYSPEKTAAADAR
jgi:hypothetical protein